MNAARFRKNVLSFLNQNKVRPGCWSSYSEEGEIESYFSRNTCECCGNTLAGNRTNYQFVSENKYEDRDENIKFEAEICDDCVYFLAYGDTTEE